MSAPTQERMDEYQDEELSLLSLGTIFLRHRWRIARWALVGGVFAAVSVISKPALYLASASFVPQGYDASRSSGMASVAGQFGVSLPSANASQSPEFYARLLRSRVVLESVVDDTLTVAEMGGKRMTFLDLFQIKGISPRHRNELGVQTLRGMVMPSVSKTTGGVDVFVSTKWRSVSLAIVTALVAGVNDYNQRTRREQAALERKFVESRLAVAGKELRDAEDTQQQFLSTNRQIGNSPELTVVADRMQRDVTMKQQIFTSMSQAYEDVRIREVRDTPVITVLEPPFVPTLPEPRGRTRSVEIGLVLGALLGTLLAFSREMFHRRRKLGSPDAHEFVGMIEEIKSGTIRSVQRLARR